jgi:predicted Rossmann-fold nucleotide-binding protein/SAM-dependent methyltransferase
MVEVELKKNGKVDDQSEIESNRLINNVTFFGDSAIPEGDPIFESVKSASKLLAKNGYTIVDGGGPGIMQAATDGAEEVNGRTIAIYWEPKLASHFEGKNTANLTDEAETYSNYVMRTLGLIEKGDIYVVCKGGTGTVSEFGMVWCLAKLYYGSHKPVILYGDFWDELIEAFQKTMYIDEVELAVLKRASTPEQLLELITSFEQMYQKLDLKPKEGDESGFVINPKVKVTVDTYKKVASEYRSASIGKNVAQVQLDEFISMVNPPAQVLDLGCGPGLDIKVLTDKYAVTGIEIVKKFADMASFENPNAEIINADVITYDLPKNKYKGIWSRDMMHHVPEEHLPEVFRKVSDALVENGIFYVIVREGQGEIYEKEKKKYSELQRFYHFFSVEELEARAKAAGLSVVKIDHVQRSHKWLVGVFKKQSLNFKLG